MKKFLLTAAAAALCACSGAGVQLKAQEAKISELRSQNDALAIQLKDRGAELDASKAAKADADAKLAESAEKLAIASGRIDSLEKSNAELSSAAGANQTELGGKLSAAVAEKDALAAKLAEEQKEKLGAVRLKGIYRSARDKAVADREKLLTDLTKTQKERDEALARLAAIDKDKEREKTAAEEAKARLHDELGPIADAILKEMQAGTAFAGASSGTITVKLSDALLFDGDTAKLTDQGAILLQRVGLALKGLGPRELRIEAHNDGAPLKRGLLGGFEDHWELSGAQAVAATRALAARAGLSPARMTAVGAAEFHAFRSDEDGCADNRCLVISAESARTP
jgi:flagellar motor protein MotB